MAERLATPVVLLTFNRPDKTARVLEAVRAAAPRVLYVVSDGPRGPRDEAGVRATRALFDDVGWDCEVIRDLAPANLGCAVRVGTGLRSAFERFERAIILEDDTLPDATFFPYADELLDRYEREERVMMIGGTRLADREPEGEASYAFTRMVAIWGWATWRRAWRHFETAHLDDPVYRYLETHPAVARWARGAIRLPGRIRRAIGAGTGWPRVDANPALRARVRSCGRFQARGMWLADVQRAPGWGFLWALTVQRRAGLVVTPRTNLVTNIGFGGDSTHATDGENVHADRPAEPLAFPLRHPAEVRLDEDYQRLCATQLDEAMAAYVGDDQPL